MTESMLNLPQASNVGVPGQFVFRVDKKTTAGEYISNQFVFKNRKPKDNYSKLLRIEYFIFIFLVLGVNLFYVDSKNVKKLCSKNKCEKED